MTRTLRAVPDPAITGADKAARILGGGMVVADGKPDAPKPCGGLRRRPGLTVKRVEAALRASSGIKTLAAELLDVERIEIVRVCEKHPRLEAVMAEEAEAVIDLAEAKLIEKIRAGDASAIRYYLDNRGGARGYGRKVQIDGGDRHPDSRRRERCRDPDRTGGRARKFPAVVAA